jgi:molybdate transport system substrate-binding protein
VTVSIKVMSAGAVESMVTALGKEYERASGNSITFVFNTAGALRERIAGGEKTDLLILSQSAIASLDKPGLFVPGSQIDLGRTVTGVAVKEGAASPDISTPEAFKQALLKARTVAYTDPKAGGSSGTFFAGMLDELGIADAVNKKAFLGKRGFEVAQAVADGRADIGTTFISEILTVKGARVVGPLPGHLYNVNTYTAAILAGSANKDAAAALLRALTDPSTRSRWTAAGLEPAFAGA